MSDTKAVPVQDRLGITRLGTIGPGGKEKVIPRNSYARHAGLRVYKTLSSVAPMPTTTFNSTAQQNFQFQQDQFDLARNFVFRFRIDVTSASVRIVPTFYWCLNIIISAMGGPAQEIMRFYPEQLIALYAAMGVDYIESMSDAIGINPKSFWLSRQVASGESAYFYLPLPVWFVYGGIGFNGRIDQTGNIRIDFNPVGSIISSGSGTVSLGEAVLMLDTDIGAPGDSEVQKGLISRYSVCGPYLAAEPVTQAAISMSASSTYNINLLNLSHKTAGLIIGFVANQNSNSANASQLYQSLGDSYGSTAPGTLDLVDTAGQSIYAGGTVLPAYHLKGMLGARNFCGAFNRFVNLYPMLFCADLKAALGGQIDDYYQFKQAALQLRVVTPPVATSLNEVQTVTLSGTATAGHFRLGWTSMATGLTSVTATLAYNAGATALGTAFNGLESVIQDRFSVAFNQDPSAGAAFTVTFTNLNGQPDDMRGNTIQVFADTLVATSTALYPTVARTTQGQIGWVAGTYQPIVIALYWRCCTKYDNGSGRALLKITDE